MGGVPVIAKKVAGMEDRGMAGVIAALGNPAFDKGKICGPALLLGFQADGVVQRSQHLDALAGTRLAGAQRCVVREFREATPGLGNRLGVAGRTAARYPASRIGGIEEIVHGSRR